MAEDYQTTAQAVALRILGFFFNSTVYFSWVFKLKMVCWICSKPFGIRVETFSLNFPDV